MQFQVTMTRDKTTKNTVVYKAPKGSAVDTLYVQQNAIMGPNLDFPGTITVTVEA